MAYIICNETTIMATTEIDDEQHVREALRFEIGQHPDDLKAAFEAALVDEATEALIAQVEREGGAIAWGRQDSTGLACTVEEEEADWRMTTLSR